MSTPIRPWPRGEASCQPPHTHKQGKISAKVTAFGRLPTTNILPRQETFSQEREIPKKAEETSKKFQEKRLEKQEIFRDRQEQRTRNNRMLYKKQEIFNVPEQEWQTQETQKT